MIINATIEPKPVLNHDEVAILAQEIWQREGCQAGRDAEYWLKAEQQLLAVSQPKKEPVKNAGAKRKTPPASKENSSTQPPSPLAQARLGCGNECQEIHDVRVIV